METAIKTPNSHIHFGAPQQNQVREYLLPIFRQVLDSCPEELRPVWKHFEGKLTFKNGSFIKLFGCNNKQYDNSRGNKSDLFIIDEARDIDELDTVVRDIALPQLLSSDNASKKVLIPSTPPSTPDHPFKRYAEKAKARGAYSEYTIDESWYSKEEVDRFIEESGGRESTTSQREYFCKFVTDSALQIIPEFDKHKHVGEIEKDDYFQFWTQVESMDVGYRDFTAWIHGYYDFNKALLVIENELALRENEFSTDKLAALIKTIERPNKERNNQRIRRIADNSNLNILADLGKIYGLPFQAVSKKGTGRVNAKEYMVNVTRQWIKNGKLVIHPRCKMLIASLEFGIWKRGADEFDRSDELGHYDFVDALIYLVAGLLPGIQNLNPIPPLYKIDIHKTMFPNNVVPDNTPHNDLLELKKLFPELPY